MSDITNCSKDSDYYEPLKNRCREIYKIDLDYAELKLNCDDTYYKSLKDGYQDIYNVADDDLIYDKSFMLSIILSDIKYYIEQAEKLIKNNNEGELVYL